MKKAIIASLAVLASAAALTTFALGGGPKLNAIFEAKATSKSFTFNAATGSQFDDTVTGVQEVYVTTGVSDPIHTTVAPESMELTLGGEGGRFVEAEPMLGDCGYSLVIGINNLTHFAIDMGVENDGGGSGDKDIYEIQLRKANLGIVEEWYDNFELDGNGNGTAHLEWDKGPTDGTVVEVNVSLHSMEDSPDTNLYIESLSLTWDC